MTQLSRFLYGGDYNPEQWPEDTWANDIQVFKQAHLNSATINVFSWALLEQIGRASCRERVYHDV